MTSPTGDQRSVCDAQETCPDHVVPSCFFPVVFLRYRSWQVDDSEVTSGIPLCERHSPKTFLGLHTEGGRMHGRAERSEG